MSWGGVMTDGDWNYTHNRALSALLTERGIRHIVTEGYTPRWNGKVERLQEKMEREWAKGLRYRNSTARNHALPHWLAPVVLGVVGVVLLLAHHRGVGRRVRVAGTAGDRVALVLVGVVDLLALDRHRAVLVVAQ